MNKRQVISSLNNIAEELDNQGLYVEAKQISNVMKKIAQGPLNTPSQEPSGETAKNALFSYTYGEIASSISRPITEARELLKKVIDAFESNKKFFNDPVYGTQLHSVLVATTTQSTMPWLATLWPRKCKRSEIGSHIKLLKLVAIKRRQSRIANQVPTLTAWRYS